MAENSFEQPIKNELFNELERKGYLAIKRCRLLDAHRNIPNGALVIKKGEIVIAESWDTLDPKIKEQYDWQDGEGYWVTPGFVNGHTHVAMSFLRDMAHDQDDMIEKLFFPLEKNLTPEMVEAFSYPSLIAGIKSGVTCFVDHYYHITAVKKAMEKVGVRGVIAETLADRGGAFPNRKMLSSLKDRLISQTNSVSNVSTSPSDSSVHSNKSVNQSGDHVLIREILGPHAMDTVSLDYMEEIGIFAHNHSIPIHLHLSQTFKERVSCLAEHNKSPVALAESAGILGPQTLAVHLITADSDDVAILKKTKTFVGLCPTSQILYEHIAPLKLFFESSLKGILGTDCAASHDSMDIMQELRSLYLAARSQGVKTTPSELLKTVWDHPNEWLQTRGGQLAPSYSADLIFHEPGFECFPASIAHTHLVMTMSSRHVRHVMVNGRFILVDQQVVGLDIEELKDEFELQTKKLGLDDLLSKTISLKMK